MKDIIEAAQVKWNIFKKFLQTFAPLGSGKGKILRENSLKN